MEEGIKLDRTVDLGKKLYSVGFVMKLQAPQRKLMYILGSYAETFTSAYDIFLLLLDQNIKDKMHKPAVLKYSFEGINPIGSN